MEANQVRAGGIPPRNRGYLDASVVGDCCYVMGGRVSSEKLVESGHFLACFDAAKSRWVSVSGIKGAAPTPRSSHR